MGSGPSKDVLGLRCLKKGVIRFSRHIPVTPWTPCPAGTQSRAPPQHRVQAGPCRPGLRALLGWQAGPEEDGRVGGLPWPSGVGMSCGRRWRLGQGSNGTFRKMLTDCPSQRGCCMGSTDPLPAHCPSKPGKHLAGLHPAWVLVRGAFPCGFHPGVPSPCPPPSLQWCSQPCPALTLAQGQLPHPLQLRIPPRGAPNRPQEGPGEEVCIP